MEALQARLAEIVGRHGKEEGLNRTRVPDLAIYRSSTLTPELRTVYEPSFFIIAQGAKAVTAGNRTFRYDSRSCLISTAHLPIAGKIVQASRERPFLSVRIDFRLETIFDMLEQTASEPLPPSATPPALSLETTGKPLLEAVVRLVALLDAPEEIPVLAPLYYKEVLFRLLATGHGPLFRELARREGNAYRISRAIAQMRRELFQPFRVEEMARSAEMGVSSFHRHFKAVTGTTPLQYLKIQRLEEAKRRILLEGTEVSQAAFSVGYESPSQFSREYARYFGHPPSRELKNRNENAPLR